MTNVANLIATNFVGGPEKQILAQSMRLNKDTFHPLVISFKEGASDNCLLGKAHEMKLSVRTLEMKNPFHPGVIMDLCRVIRADRIDLLCGHGYKSNIIGRLASWVSGIPFVAISRGWTAENARIRLYERLDKRFLHYADHVVAVSHGQREKILALGVRPEKVTVIHNAINMDEIPAAGAINLRSELGLPVDALIVASAGRLSPEKNQLAMIKAAREVIAANPRVYFVIFGEGFLRAELEREISAAGLNGHFLLPGFRNDLQAVLHEIDIFMLPSFTEGLPNVILEAFAVRKPVVATRVGGTPEVVADGVSGFLTEPHESEVMARHIAHLAGNPELRHRMGGAGHVFVREHFSFEGQTLEYERLYLSQAHKRLATKGGRL